MLSKSSGGSPRSRSSGAALSPDSGTCSGEIGDDSGVYGV